MVVGDYSPGDSVQPWQRPSWARCPSTPRDNEYIGYDVVGSRSPHAPDGIGIDGVGEAFPQLCEPVSVPGEFRWDVTTSSVKVCPSTY